MQDDWSGSKDFYIADNIFIGRHDPDKMMGWNGALGQASAGFPEIVGGPDSEYAIKVYGQGHVGRLQLHRQLARRHRHRDLRQSRRHAERELRDRVPVSIDFYGNDIYNMGDNCIETDGGAHNIRVFRNRCFNTPAAR